MKPTALDCWANLLIPVRRDGPAAGLATPRVAMARWRLLTATRGKLAVLAAALLHSVFCACAQAQPIPIFHSLYSFTNGADGGGPFPSAGLIVSGNTLYGTASDGGTNGNGTVFAVNTDGTGFRTLHTFSELLPNADEPYATNTDGADPFGGLVLVGGTLYGTAGYGGTNGDGTVFAVNTDGTGFRILYSFGMGAPYGSGSDSDGRTPSTSLTLSGNMLFGAPVQGGTNDEGVVFAVNTNGTGFTTLHMFNFLSDGEPPEGSLVLAGNELYGTTLDGGTNSSGEAGGGTVYAVNTEGTSFTVLHAFGGVTTQAPYVQTNGDGAYLQGSLLLSGNTLYGTASAGGTNGSGDVFAVNTDGTSFKVLHTFSPFYFSAFYGTWSNLDGVTSGAGLVLSGNTLYGTAAFGGTNTVGTVFAVNADGTGFTVLHTFNGLDGVAPGANLLLSNNVLYGTTSGGGTNGAGTIFAITMLSNPAIDANSLEAAEGQLQFVVTGLTPGSVVYVQASSDLSATGNWTPVSTNLVTGTNLTISGISATNGNYQFFRIAEAPPP